MLKPSLVRNPSADTAATVGLARTARTKAAAWLRLLGVECLRPFIASSPGRFHDVVGKAPGGIRHTAIAREVIDIHHGGPIPALGNVDAVQFQPEGLAAAPGDVLHLRRQRRRLPGLQKAARRKGLADTEDGVADGADLEVFASAGEVCLGEDQVGIDAVRWKGFGRLDRSDSHSVIPAVWLEDQRTGR